MEDIRDRIAIYSPDAIIIDGKEPHYFIDLLAQKFVSMFHEMSGQEREEWLAEMREQAAKPTGFKCQASRAALLMLERKQ